MKAKLHIAVGVCALACATALADASLFAKGSISRTFASSDSSQYVISVSGSGGLAIELFENVRIEARYTHISSLRNVLSVNSGSIANLRDYLTTTGIYSGGLEIDFTGPRSSFQPFISIGGGYITTDSTFTIEFNDTTTAAGPTERKQGWSVNAGVGFRVRVAKELALEVEAYGYSQDVTVAQPSINLIGNVGVRIFL